jgi:hypothetical protein
MVTTPVKNQYSNKINTDMVTTPVFGLCSNAQTAKKTNLNQYTNKMTEQFVLYSNANMEPKATFSITRLPKGELTAC